MSRRTTKRVRGPLAVTLVGLTVAILVVAILFPASWGDHGAGEESRLTKQESGTQPQTIDMLSEQDEGAAEALAEGGKVLEDLALDRVVESQGWTSMREERGELGEVAHDVLAGYRDAGDCVLVQAGYLDLFGSAWSCVVFGGEWTDVCVVGETDEEQLCQVCVLRLTKEELTTLLEQGEPWREEEQ